jgi:hypothetical protein
MAGMKLASFRDVCLLADQGGDGTEHESHAGEHARPAVAQSTCPTRVGWCGRGCRDGGGSGRRRRRGGGTREGECPRHTACICMGRRGRGDRDGLGGDECGECGEEGRRGGRVEREGAKRETARAVEHLGKTEHAGVAVRTQVRRWAGLRATQRRAPRIGRSALPRSRVSWARVEGSWGVSGYIHARSLLRNYAR